MSKSVRTSGSRVAWRRLRSEGFRSWVARALDGLADRRRETGFEATSEGEALRGLEPSAVVNVLGFPPRRSRGGVALQWLDRHDIEAQSRTVARLFPLAGRARLEIEAKGVRRRVDLGPAWSAGDAAALERTLEKARSTSGASRLHVENFHGIPLGGLTPLVRRVPTLLSIHDFSAFCFRPHLVDAHGGRFCEFSTDMQRCTRCLAAGGEPARGLDLIDLRSAASECLEHSRHLIFASEFARRAVLQRFPAAAAAASTVVPPALALAPLRPTASASREFRKAVHVAFAGAVTIEKGALHLAGLARTTRESGGRFTIFGAGSTSTDPELAPGGWFRARHLATLLRSHAVDLVVVPSEAPETHALVIDECWWAGVPVLTSDRGALPDRVRGGGGLAVPHADLSTTLASLLADRTRIAALRQSIEPSSLSSPLAAAEAMRTIYDGIEE